MRTEVYFGPWTESQYEVLADCEQYIEDHGLEMFTYNAVKQIDSLLSGQMQRAGINCRDVSRRLDISEEWDMIEKDVRMAGHKRRMEEWQTYWTPEKFHEIAQEILEKYRCIPVSGFLAVNGYGHFCQKVNKYAESFAKLRDQYDPGYKTRLCSVDSQRWLSFSEAAGCNFLLARGVKPTPGSPYPDQYSVQSGRRSGRYDMHFVGNVLPFVDQQINVEVWGEPVGSSNGMEKYAETKRQKILFHTGDPTFLQVDFRDCYQENRLKDLLSDYIDVSNMVKSLEHFPDLPSTKWSLVDEVVLKAKSICNKTPNGILPARSWFTRDKPYQHRHAAIWEPEPHVLSALGWQINEVGFGAVRQALGQGEHNVHVWTQKEVEEAFQKVYSKHHKSPIALSKDCSIATSTKNECNCMTKAAAKLGITREVCAKLSIPIRDRQTWTEAKVKQEHRDILMERGEFPSHHSNKIDSALAKRCRRLKKAAQKLKIELA